MQGAEIRRLDPDRYAVRDSPDTDYPWSVFVRDASSESTDDMVAGARLVGEVPGDALDDDAQYV
jgi:hypothetical protein